jgi:CRP-like cAMP-binding protein
MQRHITPSIEPMVNDDASNDDSSGRRPSDAAAAVYLDDLTDPGLSQISPDIDDLTPTPEPVGGAAFKTLAAKVPLLAGLPDDMVAMLQKAASIMQFSPEETILKQGEVNRNLYFLVIGTVDVYVDGGLVASLRRKGDLLGEMSVITSRPCSATIVAKTPVELVSVDTEKFKKVLGDNQEQYDHILYRIYSKILTDKVNITNQRAKKVESMLEALERAKNELQEINAQMERRVAERTQSVQSKLQDLLNQHLGPLKKTLKDSSIQSSGELKAAIDSGLGQVEEVVRVLEPIIQTFNLEISMKSRRVLLAQGQRKAQTTARMALGGTGVTLDIAATAEEAKTKLTTDKFDVVLIDGETIGLIEPLQKLNPAPKIVYIVNQGLKESLPQLMTLETVPSLVLLREDDRAGSIRSLMTTVTKLCSPNLFGLEKYLNVGVEVKELKVTKSTERQALADSMKAHFSKLGVRGTILDSAALVLEELLMNAIYDAPTDASGQPLYNQLPRTTAVELKPHEQSALRFATDGAWLAVSVRDPFGSLSAKVIMDYLDSCYGGRGGTLQEGKGGAGRGLHQIVESSSFVVFNVQAQKQTEVIALFDIVPGPKVEHSPLLHYFIS